MTRFAPLSLTLAFFLAASIGCADASAERQEELAQLRAQRRSLLTQFSSVQQAIRRVQGAALEESGVKAAQDTFNAVMRRAVLRDDPESVELLDRARVVGRDLEAMATPLLLQPGEEDQRPKSPEERAAVAAELAEVERQLRPVIDRAFLDPGVAHAFSVLRDSVVAAMLRIDPEAQRSMDMMADYEARIAEVDAELARLSQ
jgi:hypothetical protein